MKLKVSSEIAVRKLDNEIFFVTPKTSEIHSLDETGIDIWELLIQNLTFKEIGLKLSEKYDASAEIISADAEELADVLIKKGILLKIEEK